MAKRKGLYVANYKRFVVFLLIIVAVSVLIVGVTLYTISRNSLEGNFTEALIDDDMQYELLDGFYLTLDGDILSRYYYSGEAVWSKQVYADNLLLTASDRLVTIHDQKSLQVLTADGEFLYSTDVIGTINRVACGTSVVAVFSEIIEENGRKENMIYFYNTSGNLFDSINFYPQQVLDYGFLDADNLWVLTTDPTNVVPVSRIITYKPGVSMTGLTSLYSELVEKVYFNDEDMYIATTTHLLKYNLFGQQLSSIVIYDWQVKSAAFSSDSVYFAAVPRAQNADEFYSNARILTDTTSSKVNLPKNIESLLLSNAALYLFGQDTIYVYSAAGEYQRQYKVNEPIHFIARASNNQVLVTREENYYFLQLP